MQLLGGQSGGRVRCQLVGTDAPFFALGEGGDRAVVWPICSAPRPAATLPGSPGL